MQWKAKFFLVGFILEWWYGLLGLYRIYEMQGLLGLSLGTICVLWQLINVDLSTVNKRISQILSLKTERNPVLFMWQKSTHPTGDIAWPWTSPAVVRIRHGITFELLWNKIFRYPILLMRAIEGVIFYTYTTATQNTNPFFKEKECTDFSCYLRIFCQQVRLHGPWTSQAIIIIMHGFTFDPHWNKRFRYPLLQ